MLRELSLQDDGEGKVKDDDEERWERNDQFIFIIQFNLLQPNVCLCLSSLFLFQSFSLLLCLFVFLSLSLCISSFFLSLYVCMCVLVSEFPFIPLSLSDYLNNSFDLLMTKFFVSDMHNHTNEADNYVYLKAAFYINEADMHIRQDWSAYAIIMHCWTYQCIA